MERDHTAAEVQPPEVIALSEAANTATAELAEAHTAPRSARFVAAK